jgi:hypothetical protein
LLHGYQTMVRDAIRYITAQLDIPPNFVWARFAGDARQGGRAFDQSAWDYLPPMYSEFHLVKMVAENSWFSISFFVISDTGFLQGKTKSKEVVAGFAPVEESTTRFAVILHRSHREHFYFMNEKTELWDFVKPDGALPESVLQQADKEFVGKSYDMSFLTSEEEANKIVQDLVEIAKAHSFPLGLKKTISQAG